MQCKEKWFITYFGVIIEQCLLQRDYSFFYNKNDKVQFMLNVIMSGKKVGGWTSSITKYICFAFFLYVFVSTITLTYVIVLFLHSFSHAHCILASTCIVFVFVYVLVAFTVFYYFYSC